MFNNDQKYIEGHLFVILLYFFFCLFIFVFPFQCRLETFEMGICNNNNNNYIGEYALEFIFGFMSLKTVTQLDISIYEWPKQVHLLYIWTKSWNIFGFIWNFKLLNFVRFSIVPSKTSDLLKSILKCNFSKWAIATSSHTHCIHNNNNWHLISFQLFVMHIMLSVIEHLTSDIEHRTSNVSHD